jgi:hypothetical protein
MSATKRYDIKKALSRFTPEEQGSLQAMATMRVEHGVMQKQLAELKGAYDSLYAVMVTLLDAMPDKEIRLHASQLLRFKAEYRVDQKREGEEFVLRLLTLNDEVG